MLMNKLDTDTLRKKMSLIDTSKVSDEVLELWYGSKETVKVLKLIEACEIKDGITMYSNSVKIEYSIYYKYYMSLHSDLTLFISECNVVLYLNLTEIDVRNSIKKIYPNINFKAIYFVSDRFIK